MADANKKLELSTKIKTMRDVFDYCRKNGLHNLAQGMIELPPPLKLREIVAAEATSDACAGIHQYRDRFGEEVFRTAISGLLAAQYKITADKDSILCTSGVSGAIVSTLMALRKKGKGSVALIAPFYTYHQRQVEEVFGEGSCRHIESHGADQLFAPRWDLIEAAVMGRENPLHGIIVCNPGNPSGRVWSADDMRRLVALCEKNAVTLIVDEIYCDLVWHGEHYSPVQEALSPYVVVCRGFSKTLGAQSWRVGYAISHASTIAALMTQHDPIYISVNWFQHSLAEYLSQHPADYADHVARTGALLRANWTILSEALRDALGWTPIEPHGSMYGMFYHKSASDVDAMIDALDVGVGVAPGNMFFPGTPANSGYTRIHCGITEDKARAIAADIRAKAAARKAAAGATATTA